MCYGRLGHLKDSWETPEPHLRDISSTPVTHIKGISKRPQTPEKLKREASETLERHMRDLKDLRHGRLEKQLGDTPQRHLFSKARESLERSFRDT